jgi:hypothetical protein
LGSQRDLSWPIPPSVGEITSGGGRRRKDLNPIRRLSVDVDIVPLDDLPGRSASTSSASISSAPIISTTPFTPPLTVSKPSEPSASSKAKRSPIPSSPHEQRDYSL